MTAVHSVTVGDGPAIVVVGGALRSAASYERLAEELALRGWRAVVMQRRGRPGSPPRNPSVDLDVECDDLAEVATEADARAVFGHSFGGLVALEASARGAIAVPLVLYEPGVSVGGSHPDDWIAGYRALLAEGRRRAAFAYFVRHSPGAPAIVGHLPSWYLRVVLALVMRKAWPDIDPLLEANADEHQLVADCDDHVGSYRDIAQPVRLIGGSKSPPALTTVAFEALSSVLPDCRSELVAGLDHFGPDDKAPATVAERTDRLLRATGIRHAGG